jgi:hypothetical protein
MTNNDNGSEYPTMLDNSGVLQLPPVVDDDTTSFSKEASRVTTNWLKIAIRKKTMLLVIGSK